MSESLQWRYCDAHGTGTEYAWGCPECVRELRRALKAAESRAEETRRLYDELLYQVGMKYPGESRHQTALRYLQLAETHVSGPAFAALRGEVKP